MLKTYLQLLLNKFTKKSEFNSMLSSAFIYTGETSLTQVPISASSGEVSTSNPVIVPFDAYMTAYSEKPSDLINNAYWAVVNINGQDFVYSTSYGDSGGVQTPPILVRKGDTVKVRGYFILKAGQGKVLRFFKFNR
jgi:hypothetical protein|nr:MAG TPA: hypothetical protein [Caudoviricetes sp.]